MIVKQGFSLLEFLLYLFLLVLVTTIAVDFMTSRYIALTKYGNRCDNSITICAAFDLLERDIQTTISPETQWKLITTNEYIWADTDKDIGWQVKNGRLIRSEGAYDASEAMWIHAVRGVIAEHIAHLRIKPQHTENGVASVLCVLESTKAHCSLHRIIALRNRNI